MTASQIDVLIVGGGPVGLALSIDLSWRGVRHMLIDQQPRAARSLHPRMDQVSVRSMEFIRRWGATAEIEQAGFPRDIARDIVFATAVLGHELEREPVASDATRAPPPFSPEKHELCPQDFFDPALQRIAHRSPLADIRYRHRLVGFSNEDGRVTAEIEDVATRAAESIVCRFLAGCDGAGSFVAQQLGIEADEAQLLASSTNIFIESPELTARTAAQPGYRYILIGPGGTWASMIRMNGRARWRLQILGDAGRAEWTEAETHAAIRRAIGRDIPYQLLSIVPWTRRELVVSRFSRGNCFLVGDAAHQLSPTGGYGMNTGIAEAVDLSWKLAATIEGWGGSALLASYDTERRPVAVRNARRSTVNFRRMRSVAPETRLLDEDGAGAAARERVGRAVRAATHEEWDSMGIHLGYSYARSPIVCAEPGVDPESSPGLYIPSAAPGARAPHLWLAPGHSTLDLFGRGFVLLALDPRVDPAPLVEAAAARSMPLEVVRIAGRDVRVAYERALVLIRPDGHVAWRGDMAPDDALAIIDRVRGADGERGEPKVDDA